VLAAADVAPDAERIVKQTGNLMIRRVAGTNGVIEVYSDHLKIHRPGGCLAPFPKGEKMIAYSRLSGVQYKPPTRLAGFIQFIFSGSSEHKGGTLDATKDENTVFFAANAVDQFEFIRDFDQDRILNPPNSNPPPLSPQSSGADGIEKLAKLGDRGIITSEEFEAKKRQIFGPLN
jgi:hypothetical protein